MLDVPEGTVKSRPIAAKRELVALAEKLLPPSAEPEERPMNDAERWIDCGRAATAGGEPERQGANRDSGGRAEEARRKPTRAAPLPRPLLASGKAASRLPYPRASRLSGR